MIEKCLETDRFVLAVSGQYKEDFMRHLMSPLDFSVDELDKLLDLANDIEKYPQKYAHACEGKKLATCFYEPSTRTRLSFGCRPC